MTRSEPIAIQSIGSMHPQFSVSYGDGSFRNHYNIILLSTMKTAVHLNIIVQTVMHIVQDYLMNRKFRATVFFFFFLFCDIFDVIFDVALLK